VPSQLTFDLPVRSAFGREDFFVAPSNEVALRSIERWRDWPGNRLIVTGNAGSGKTHLARVWQGDVAGHFQRCENGGTLKFAPVPEGTRLVLEDIDEICGDSAGEEALFHLVNRAQGGEIHLLMTATCAPARIGFRLPDLKSRIEASFTAAIAPPDDALLATLLVKQFNDRQLVVPPGVIEFLLGRMERSAASVQRLVVALDREALALKRPVTRRLAGQVLDKL